MSCGKTHSRRQAHAKRRTAGKRRAVPQRRGVFKSRHVVKSRKARVKQHRFKNSKAALKAWEKKHPFRHGSHCQTKLRHAAVVKKAAAVKKLNTSFNPKPIKATKAVAGGKAQKAQSSLKSKKA